MIEYIANKLCNLLLANTALFLKESIIASLKDILNDQRYVFQP